MLVSEYRKFYLAGCQDSRFRQQLEIKIAQTLKVPELNILQFHEGHVTIEVSGRARDFSILNLVDKEKC